MILLFLALTAPRAGTYRLVLDAASEARVPVLGWQKSTTHSISLVTLDDGGRWLQKVCSIEIQDRSPLARTEVSAAFVASLAVTDVQAHLDGDQLQVDLGVFDVGWDSTATPTLPEAYTDIGVVDHESDGRPGATVRIHLTGIGTYDIDVVQTSHAVLEGRRDGLGWTGTVRTLLMEQRVLGADLGILRTSLRIRPRDQHSTFALTPTPSSTCAELLAAEP